MKVFKGEFALFILGVICSLFSVATILWGGEWSDLLVVSEKINSLIAMGVVYTGTFISLSQLFSYISQQNVKQTISTLLFWLVITIFLMFALQFEFDIFFIVISSVMMLVFFVFLGFFKINFNQKIIGYIPLGRVTSLPDCNQVKWKKLMSQQLPNEDSIDAVMADLRASLPIEWECFLAKCTLKGIPVYHSGVLLEKLTGRVKVDHMYENDLGHLLPSKYYQITKRIFDVVIIFLSTPVTVPIMLVTALLIFLEGKGGIFFSQDRIGQNGKPFRIYKFRSMHVDKQTTKTTLKGDSRITKVGKFIRKTRIDELPQFYNVLKGEMSLIGPRAEFSKFAKEYENKIPFYSYRHIVKPGISGWAQVMQGYNYGVDQTKIKLEYDFYYIKNFSFSLDFLIFFKTIRTMVTGFGAK